MVPVAVFLAAGALTAAGIVLIAFLSAAADDRRDSGHLGAARSAGAAGGDRRRPRSGASLMSASP